MLINKCFHMTVFYSPNQAHVKTFWLVEVLKGSGRVGPRKVTDVAIGDIDFAWFSRRGKRLSGGDARGSSSYCILWASSLTPSGRPGVVAERILKSPHDFRSTWGC